MYIEGKKAPRATPQKSGTRMRNAISTRLNREDVEACPECVLDHIQTSNNGIRHSLWYDVLVKDRSSITIDAGMSGFFVGTGSRLGEKSPELCLQIDTLCLPLNTIFRLIKALSLLFRALPEIPGS